MPEFSVSGGDLVAKVRDRFMKMDIVERIFVFSLSAVVGLGVIVAIISGISHAGGGGNTQQAGTTQLETPTVASDGATPAEVTPETTASEDSGATSTTAGSGVPLSTTDVGQTLLTKEDADAICQSNVASGGSQASEQSINLLAGRKALIDCSADATDDTGATQTQTTIISYDLFNRTAAWSHALGVGSSYATGTQHLIELDHVNHPAVGLKDAYTTYSISAIDLSTGKTAWSTPIDTWINSADLTSSEQLGVAEDSAEVASGNQQVIVSLHDTSAYNASTGKLLWHVPTVFNTQASGWYQDAGVVVVDGGMEPGGFTDNEYGSHWTGVDPRTGKIVWDLKAPDWLQGDSHFEGNTLLAYGGNGYLAADLVTGKKLGKAQFPAGWENVAVHLPYVVAKVGGHLKLFKLTNLNQPVWSIPADGDVLIYAATAGHLLVGGPSGTLLLSTADGSTTKTFDSGQSFSAPSNGVPIAVDGLASDNNGSVVELDPPTGH